VLNSDSVASEPIKQLERRIMRGKFWLTVWAIVLVCTAPALAAWDRAWTKNLNSDVVAQFEISLRRGETKAKNCFQTLPVTARGPVKLSVVFDGNRGRIIETVVQAPYADTVVTACLRRAFIGEIILPFDGEPRTVMVTFDP
jgi:hypothetical protein